MPVRVYVGVGSNINARRNIRLGIDALRKRFGQLIISPVYESEPIGFSGKNFHNLVIGFNSNETWKEVVAALHEIEAGFGRNQEVEPLSSRNLDLDLLLYGDLVIDDGQVQLPRPDVIQYAFVLRPLAEVAGDYLHPVLGRNYQELWRTFDRRGQQLWPVDLDTE